MLVQANSIPPSRLARFTAPPRSMRYLGFGGPADPTLITPPQSGPMTDEQIVQAIGAGVLEQETGDHLATGTLAAIRSALGALQLQYDPQINCSGLQGGSAKILNISASIAGSAGKALSTASGAVASGGSSAGSLFGLSIAGGPIAPILMGIAGALSIFGAIFAHHAAKVAEEQKITCAAVPAANTSIQSIQQAVSSGTITPAQGAASMQQLYSDFAQMVQPILKRDSSHCNAACGYSWQLQAIAMKLINQFQNMPAPGLSQLVGSPNLLWLAGGALGLFLLFSLAGGNPT